MQRPVFGDGEAQKLIDCIFPHEISDIIAEYDFGERSRVDIEIYKYKLTINSENPEITLRNLVALEAIKYFDYQWEQGLRGFSYVQINRYKSENKWLWMSGFKIESIEQVLQSKYRKIFREKAALGYTFIVADFNYMMDRRSDLADICLYFLKFEDLDKAREQAY